MMMSNKQTEDLEKDIVSFDQAIELATIGFDKQTLCGYDIADRQLYLCQVDEDGIYMPQKDLAAPTKSQVFRWLSLQLNDKDIMIPVDYDAQNKLIDVLIDKLKN
jgi:hypothetical protein